jgi:uncharacterized protein (TIGR02217 family)
MAFIETPRFPDDISRGMRGGPMGRTQIAQLANKREERNSPWAGFRHVFDVRYGIRRADDLAAVNRLFLAAHARLHGFRLKDWRDYKSCAPSATPSATDQDIGVGDDQETEFQLVKLYDWGVQGFTRPIAKPVAGTVLVAVDGTPLASEDYSVDATTGIVTLDAAAGDGLVVTAGFEFDVPVRFDTDRLDTELDIERLGSITSIPLIEIEP